VNGQGHATADLPSGQRADPHRTGGLGGTVWTGAENVASEGLRSPDRPARSKSLYRPSYRGP